MTAFQNVMQRFDQRARIGLALGSLLIVVATVAVAAWLLRTDEQVLFADLAPQDAATIVAELDKMKVPYRLSGDGNTVLVPADLVYPTRLKLVGRELPLRGAVGLELFNASEVGMTEFTQKVNYQRALQGEITRTIQSLDEVESVRVHLVLAEQTLFKKTGKQAKASITVAVKPGRSLDGAQVQGIQRLVAAAVPDIKADDVTIVDQRGVALTRRAGDSAEVFAGAGAALDDKRALEAYINKKVVDVLDATFGAGHGIATVDVALNHDQTKVTTERVLGAVEAGAKSGAGVMVRERRTTSESADDAETEGAGGTLNHEADYQVGRRVEQVVSGAGGVARISVAVVLRDVVDAAQLERVKDVVARAAGIDPARGDSVSVYSMNQVAPPVLASAPAPLAEVAIAAEMAPAPVAPPTDGSRDTGVVLSLLAIGAAVLALGATAASWQRRRRPVQARLSLQQREEMLARVQGWLDAAPQPVKERV